MSDSQEAREESLSHALKRATRSTHRRAEKAGVVARILAGNVSLENYAEYLRNLHPVYQALENRFEHPARAALSGAISHPGLSRTASIESDLGRLAGRRWSTRIPVKDVTLEYVSRIQAACDCRLAAHAYVRYLGDLNGGKILATRLGGTLGLSSEELSFYAFPGIDDVASFTSSFKSALDSLNGCREEMIREALTAFELNIRLAEDIVCTPGQRASSSMDLFRGVECSAPGVGATVRR